ncbi:MAG: hypothetical protein IPJ88_09860 [Myxococcales bacterium]|nr:MAG: hypothetical protein IPJ88_09860 [Myxococcales bacterium]
MGLFRYIYATLLRSQCRKPWLIVAVAFALAALALPVALKLDLNSHWRALLPETKASVRDLDQIGDQVGGVSTLTVALESTNVEAMQRFAKALVPLLNQALAGKILRIDWNIGSYKDFVEEHKHLFMSLEDLEEFRDDLQDRVSYEKLHANPLYIDLENKPPPEIDSLVNSAKEKAEARSSEFGHFPSGYYVHPDGNLLVIFIRTNIEGGDPEPSKALIKRVTDIAQSLHPKSYANDLKISMAGDVPEALEEHEAITEELVVATTATIILVLLAIFIFFLRLRAIPLLGLSLIPPVVLTFACAEYAVDYLNTSTAFFGQHCYWQWG